MIGFDFFCHEQKVAIDEKRKTSLYNKLISLVASQFIVYKELESLIGQLEFVAPLMFPLKACIRRFRNALPKIRNPGQLISVDTNIINEANLWLKFLPILPGVPVKELIFQPILDTVVTTDASNWGFGCFWPPHWYLQAFHLNQVNPNGTNNISD